MNIVEWGMGIPGVEGTFREKSENREAAGKVPA